MIELFYTFVFYIISCVFIHSFDSMRNCNVNSQENEKETFNSLYLTGSVEKHLFTRIYFMYYSKFDLLYQLLYKFDLICFKFSH